MQTGNLTPKYVARIIAPGARERIGVYGRYITVVSISASTVTIAIQDDPEQLLVNGMQIDCEKRLYDSFTLHNTGAVPTIVVLYLSETLVVDLRANNLLTGIAASLVAIDVDTDQLVLIHGHIATMEAALVNIEGSTAAMAIDLAALEVLVTAGNVDLAALEALVIASTIAVSDGGSFEVLTPNATTAANGANQACRECMFWTADTHIHFKLGTTDADGTTTLLLANTVYSVPIHNTDHLRFYNGAALASTGINIIWRN